MKLVHAADLHLDSPLRGLERYEGAPVEQIRGATRRALENLIDLCLDEGAELLLLAGDLYDGNWKDYSTGLFLAAQISRLRREGVAVVWIRGNHDAASQITRHLQLPDNAVELSTRKPETHILERLGIAVHGQGFASRAVEEDLAARYPPAIPGLFNIGLLHTCATGREGHDSYAPCSLETLISKGYDYWALGHVHRHEVLSSDPWIVFPGNLQGRHARETGAKGAVLVEVEGGRVRHVVHRPLDAVRWAAAEVEVSEARSAEDAVDLARAAMERLSADSDGRTVAVRLTLTGSTAAHASLQRHAERWENALRAAANDVGGEGIWLEKVRFDTRGAVDLEPLSERDDAASQVVRALRELQSDPQMLETLLGELGELRARLPNEAREGEDGLRLDDPETIREALRELERSLLPQLLSAAEET